MHYTIEVNYQTGNSFGTEECTEILDRVWHNLEMCEKSLERINNHYKYYEKHSDMWSNPKGKKPEGVVWDDKYRMIMLELLDDDGKPFLYHPDWCGYLKVCIMLR